MTESMKFKCAKCDAPLQGNGVEPKPGDIISCPDCGESDTLENVLSEIGEYASDHFAGKLSADLRKIASGSKFLQFSEGNRPKKVYRFVVDLEHR